MVSTASQAIILSIRNSKPSNNPYPYAKKEGVAVQYSPATVPGPHGRNEDTIGARDRVAVLSPSEFEDNDDAVALDHVREEHDYRSVGHLPGAANIPIDAFRDPVDVAAGLLPERDSFVETLGEAGIVADEDIISYEGGEDVMAPRFLLTGAIYGHEGRLLPLEGGYDTWATDHATVTDPMNADAADYELARTGG